MMHTTARLVVITLLLPWTLVFAQVNGQQKPTGIGVEGQPQFSSQTLPDPSTYQHSVSLANVGSGNYSMAFALENGAKSVRFLMMLSGVQLNRAWMGIGFGSSMLSSGFIITHLLANGSVEMHEHTHRNQYAPPTSHEDPKNWVMEPLNGGYVNGIMFSEFRRPVDPPPPVEYPHVTLSFMSPQHMIWAYNPASKINTLGHYFTYHMPNDDNGNGLPHLPNQTHGALLVDYTRATVEPIPLNPYPPKVAHGSLMFIAWLVILPMGAFISRYLRFIPNWIYFHLTAQLLGVLIIITSFVVILATYINYNYPHAILGTTMIGLLCLQLLLGLGNRKMLRSVLPYSPRRQFIRIFHRTLGYTLLLAAIAQVALGLRILFPFEERRGLAFWIVYIIVAGLWILLFLGTELYRRLFLSVKDKTVPAPEVEQGNKFLEAGKPVPKGMTELAKVQDEKVYPDLLSYDWRSLDKAVSDGAILVVANGRYVYDASQWLRSHPGGQIILLAVAGTDISSDYFHEAGYDAAEFTPPRRIPLQRAERQDVTTLHESIPSTTPSNLAPDSLTSMSGTTEFMETSHYLTEEDWSKIVRARRTHVHTKVAIMRLSNLLVGELHPSHKRWQKALNQGSEPTLVNQDVGDGNDDAQNRLFDPEEYRRYALTSKTLVNPNTPGHPIFRLRFCLLYPYERRQGEPEIIYPGQAMEIQIRPHADRIPLSRYYSPVHGNMMALEVLVKMYPGDGVSGYLGKQRLGERQFKIRGPLGDPLVGPERPLGFGGTGADWVPEDMLFVSAGTGITPFLQLLQYLFLPTSVPLLANGDYTPAMSDEIALHEGDTIVVQHHYLDGWALGRNITTGEEGAFPLPKTHPRTSTKLTLLNAVHAPQDIIGTDLIDAVLLSYPRHLQVHHVISLREGSVENVSGFVYRGHVCEAVLAQAVSNESMGDEENERRSGRHAVVCGPPQFNSAMVDQLIYKFGYQSTDVTMLTSDSPYWYHHLETCNG
ncbi:uncharacterized protein SPPG_00880 [Spizellomyces punctatus DAOM BR117]|uniref:Cytochrome b5 heme-binding domain-containing protein n=1 Tax=Spizellomyces punctatus (strain DAOM BR117) TaxID=645134 RepID=A0A0L0HQK5_SPIPD|nr:uncharacterized protein SPPG_00880 [Spizellomyces punctatus DAOM BR117]KND03392.1 hypothetical protein SPPG_00880 [Spizellomyces punctatus DAOM BR117]|eukprot:XP_016611431.1 hypothetical protein SPPG_00880 [Spizellomyces punctatus DAOM BR117]